VKKGFEDMDTAMDTQIMTTDSIDDLFRRLKRINNNDMSELYYRWCLDPDDRRKLHEMLKDSSWTVEEFKETFTNEYDSTDRRWR